MFKETQYDNHITPNKIFATDIILKIIQLKLQYKLRKSTV